MLSILLLFYFSLFSQDKEISESIDLYKESLRSYVIEMKNFQPDWDTIYVKESFHLQNIKSGKLEGIYIKVVNESFIHHKTRRNKKLPLTVIHPLIVENGSFIVYVVHFDVTRKGKHYNMANVDRVKSKMTYDCSRLAYNIEIVK